MHAPRRPTVLLLGDSIRMGYQPSVRQELGDRFDVSGPAENCATSRNLLANLDRWVLGSAASIIHLNAGLHDLRYDPGRDAPVVSMDEYESNVRTILGRLRERTEARLIWATTTPVHEKLHAEQKLSRRRESDVTSYNAIATRIAGGLDVEVDDLCAAVLAHGPDALWSQDGVHFSDAGSRFLGAQVARAIRRS
ncbi:MAG TPA: SGNH/GDSL hydrolase family protein [Thermoanaerobaculia bacterium]|jgi:lysophospholipase L1-like esterase